jgi:hypothetical protein
MKGGSKFPSTDDHISGRTYIHELCFQILFKMNQSVMQKHINEIVAHTDNAEQSTGDSRRSNEA